MQRTDTHLRGPRAALHGCTDEYSVRRSSLGVPHWTSAGAGLGGDEKKSWSAQRSEALNATPVRDLDRAPSKLGKVEFAVWHHELSSILVSVQGEGEQETGR